ncbi:acyltransferase [Scandinavium sp. H11S7]|uniref:Acyltransferase n=1 Tax=Scandinavium hiltneri TaxID=2926519 RepID=A0ABT2E3A5_9ENTR|nr:acyltransferase [Scandinavium hiltneri]MCS2161490.1 acyltransferase [Scandinavium hiltneri]
MLMIRRFFKVRPLDELMKSKVDVFSFIRLSAALLVLYAHSYHIFGLGADPLTRKIGVYTGTLAVYIFFTISGFFILQSAMKRTFLEYAISRLARIFPGLIVANVATIFVIIPLAHNVDYFSFVFSSFSWDYIKINSLLENVVFSLPDVFSNNPDHAINGSLWTLPVEVRAYFCALLFVALGITATRGSYNSCFIIFILIDYFFSTFYQIIFPIPGAVSLIFFFCVGGGLYINRSYIPVSPLLVIAVASFLLFYRSAISPLFIAVLISYLVISSGYVFGVLKFINLKHDYSYGLYLYAYPISQVSYSLLNYHGFIVYFIFICFATSVAAFFSWHCVEKPVAYFAKAKIIPYTSSMIRRFNMINVRDGL